MDHLQLKRAKREIKCIVNDYRKDYPKDVLDKAILSFLEDESPKNFKEHLDEVQKSNISKPPMFAKILKSKQGK